MAANVALRMLRYAGFQLETSGFKHSFCISDFTVVKPLQSAFVTLCSDFYRSLIKFIFVSLRNTIVFIIILASVLGVLGQVNRVLV